MNSGQHIILFDGVCNLCNKGVQFIIKRDKKNNFKFASLQSATGQILLQKHQINTKSMDTFVYIEEDKAFIKSTAALKIAKNLKYGWPLLYVFIVVPAYLRNLVYDIVAKNRYRWFGKKNSCMIPSRELKAKFLD